MRFIRNYLRKLYHCKKLVLFFILFTALLVLLRKDIVYKNVILLSELDKCPACYGRSLCNEFFVDRIELLGWQKFRIFTNFNKKNVFFARYKNKTVVLKKLAHDSELFNFDKTLCQESNKYEYGSSKKCDPSWAAHVLPSHVQIDDLSSLNAFDKTDILLCPTVRALRKLRHSFREGAHFSNDSESYFLTLLLINPEPLFLQTFTSENGWPFPRYLGACGRVIVEEYVGPSLSTFQYAPLWMRLNLALQITYIAQNLTNTSEGLHLYMTDVSFHNFAVADNGRVILVDVENIIVVDHESIANTELYQSQYDGNHLTFSVHDLCSNKIADHNFYVVCKGLLSDTLWFDGMREGLLHDVPQWLDDKWQLKNLLAECVDPSVKFGRFAVFSLLQVALQNALSEV